MPWDLSDVSGFTKAAKTAKQKRQWIAVANGALKRCLADGGNQEDCEASAIKQGNAVVKEGDMSEVTVTVGVPMVADNARIIPELPPGTLIPDITDDPVEEIAAGDVESVEVYSMGFTSRPGYSPHANGLILVFMRQ